MIQLIQLPALIKSRAKTHEWHLRKVLRKIFKTCIESQRIRTISALVVIAVAVLAITSPFFNQAFSIDGPLELDFAQRQVDSPLAQDLPNYEYWGVTYDSYFNTQPRFLSSYLSLIIRISGAPSEVPIHLSLIIFPLIGGFGMYYLGRRFRVSGLAAALLFLVSPMLMVNAHGEMVDVPGTCLWVAAIAVFIRAVDKRSNWYLGLSALLMLLTTQTYFQGLAVLPLAVAYLVINRQFRFRNFIPVIFAGLFFGAYLLTLNYRYGQIPHFAYRRRYSFILARLRGIFTVLGGTLFFPFVALAGFIVRWTSALIFVGASVITWSWSIVKYDLGEYSFSDMALFSIMLPVGITVAYLIFERFLAGIYSSDKRNSPEGRDTVFLAVWFFGVLSYASFLLPYPAPRYLLPILPPVVLSLLIIWKVIIRSKWLRFSLVTGAIALSLVFSTMLSMMYRDYADNGKLAAEWVIDNYGHTNGVWYNGGFGFGYYLKRYGFNVTPSILSELYVDKKKPLNLAEPQPGDHVVYSVQNGAWVPYPSVMQRLRLENVQYFYNCQLFYMPCAGEDVCWWDALFLPFTIDTRGEPTDELMVWRIDNKPNPLDESQKELYREVGITWIEDIAEK